MRSLRSNSTRRERRGFTLLEMLLAAILSAMLMLSLWGLFGTYTRLFETGQAKAERSQLVRGLGQQLADDLRATLPPPVPPGSSLPNRFRSSLPGMQPTASATFDGTQSPQSFPPASLPADSGLNATGSTAPSSSTPTSTASDSSSDNRFGGRGGSQTLRTAGLIGTLRALQLDLLQVSSDPSTLPRPAPLVSTGRQPRPLVAPELRSVLYTFEPPRDVRATDRKPPPGLVRREKDWQSLWEETAGVRNNSSQASGNSVERAISQSIMAFGLNSSDAVEQPADETTTSIPEIIALEFHYFDGRQWLTEWDSRQRQSLPAAVEVAMRIRDVTRKPITDHDSTAVAKTVTPATKGTARTDSAADASNKVPTIRYRDCIVLPQSRLYPAQNDPLASDRMRQRPGSTPGSSLDGRNGLPQPGGNALYPPGGLSP